jgi:hypothetical protein
MMMLLHPTYTLRLEIQDKAHQATGQGISVNLGGGPKPHMYFDGLTGKTGCDEVLNAVRTALEKSGIQHFSVYFEKFEHRG